jgi:pimeloyl-ACP methyl ester carboxylesterase
MDYPKSEIAQTAKCPVEYSLTGSGPVVLIIHGGGGGYDQGLLLTSWVPEEFSRLSVSRPGYLRTPAHMGTTAAEQADVIAALLDTLHIDNVIVVTASSGGAPTYAFVLKYPKYIRALVAIDALTGQYFMPQSAGWLAEKLFMSRAGLAMINALGQRFPSTLIGPLYKTESLLNKEGIKNAVSRVCKDPTKCDFILNLMSLLSDFKYRKAGMQLELEFYKHLPTHLDLCAISCPALIIHGTHDADVLFYHGAYAAQSIPNAEHLWIHEGSHFAFWLSDYSLNVQRRAKSFLLGVQ